MSIYVGNLNYEVTQQDLNEAFGEFGTVKQVHLPTDRETYRICGFGFVKMETDEQETEAINSLDGSKWMGRTLRVNKARLREYSSGDGGTRRFSR